MRELRINKMELKEFLSYIDFLDRFQGDCYLYLAGPMRGYTNFNYDVFNETENVLSDKCNIFNPAKAFGGATDKAFSQYMRVDINAILDEKCHGVLLLPGWEYSEGATLEANIAKALGLFLIEIPVEFLTQNVESSKRLLEEIYEINVVPATVQKDDRDRGEQILDEAKNLVFGPRRSNYDHPHVNFNRIARGWEEIFGVDHISTTQVGMAMIWVKVARMINTPDHWDSIVDIAGYAATIGSAQEREGKE